MEDQNQRIIFSIPSDTTAIEIIWETLEKIGITDPGEDLSDESKTPKLILINNTAKDLFAKKITEEKVIELFQNEFKISKENATTILNVLKEKILPFAKIIFADKLTKQITQETNFANSDKLSFPDIKEKINNETVEEIKTPIISKTKIKKIPNLEIIQEPATKKNTGPDTYREPIE